MSRTFNPSSGVTLNVKFGDVAHELLTDFLTHLNSLNKKKLFSLNDCCDCFKDPRLMGGFKSSITVSAAGSTTFWPPVCEPLSCLS